MSQTWVGRGLLKCELFDFAAAVSLTQLADSSSARSVGNSWELVAWVKVCVTLVTSIGLRKVKAVCSGNWCHLVTVLARRCRSRRVLGLWRVTESRSRSCPKCVGLGRLEKRRVHAVTFWHHLGNHSKNCGLQNGFAKGQGPRPRACDHSLLLVLHGWDMDMFSEGQGTNAYGPCCFTVRAWRW